MSVDVANGFAEAATYRIVENAKGRLRIAVEDEAPRRSVDIGSTNAVGPRSEVNERGRAVTELRDLVGGKVNADEVGALLDRLTSGEGKGRGPVEGVAGVELVGLASDAFTVEIDNGRAVDALTFEVGEAFLDDLARGPDLGDGKSRLAVIESGRDFVGGTRGSGLRDVLNDGSKNEIAGVKGRAQILEAALDPEEGRVALLGVEADEFAVRLENGGLSDTFVFTGRDAERAVARVAADPIDLADNAPELAILGPDREAVFGTRADVAFGPTDADAFDAIFAGDPADTAAAGELADFLQTNGDDPRLRVVDQGDTIRVELIGPGTADVVVLPEGLLDGT